MIFSIPRNSTCCRSKCCAKIQNCVTRVRFDLRQGQMSPDDYRRLLQEVIAEERENAFSFVEFPLLVDMVRAQVPADALGESAAASFSPSRPRPGRASGSTQEPSEGNRNRIHEGHERVTSERGELRPGPACRRGSIGGYGENLHHREPGPTAAHRARCSPGTNPHRHLHGKSDGRSGRRACAALWSERFKGR